MLFDREDYSKARTLATFVYLVETFRVVRRRFDGRPWRKYLMVLHGNAPVSNDGRAWNDVTDPDEAARLCLAYMQTRPLISKRDSLAAGLARIHGPPAHGGRPSDVPEY